MTKKVIKQIFLRRLLLFIEDARHDKLSDKLSSLSACAAEARQGRLAPLKPVGRTSCHLFFNMGEAIPP